jgi:sugar lactone lactonase YvrE/predicted RNA-binding Zn-ribbon protein involved in translation (DUF1610 family)
MKNQFSQPQVWECPSCGATLALPDSDSFECDYCGKLILVPPELRRQKPSQEVTDNVEHTPGTITLEQQLIEITRTKIDSPRPKTSKLILALSLSITVLLAGAILVVLALMPSNSSPVNTAGPGIKGHITQLPTQIPFAQLGLVFGSEGNQPGRFNDGRWIAVDPQGNIFVADYTTGRINKFDPQGNFLQLIQVKSADANPDIYIFGLAADESGNLYVSSDGRILKYEAASGKLLMTIPDQWPEIYFDSIVAGPDGNLYSTNGMAGADDVIILDPSGQVLSRWTETIEKVNHDDPAVQLSLGVDQAGKVYILSPIGNKVYSFNPDGGFSLSFGEPGENPGQFELSMGRLAVTKQDYLVVADVYRVDLYDKYGNYMDQTFTVDYNIAGGSMYDMAIDLIGDLYFISSGGKVLKFEMTYPGQDD